MNLGDCWGLALLVYVWVVCYFRRLLLLSLQIPILCPGSVWQCTLLCLLWCQAAGPPKSSRSQAWNREKRLLCDWISFWAPRCLINENDPEQRVKPLSAQWQSPCPSTVSLTGFHKVCQAFLICWLRPLRPLAAEMMSFFFSDQISKTRITHFSWKEKKEKKKKTDVEFWIDLFCKSGKLRPSQAVAESFHVLSSDLTFISIQPASNSHLHIMAQFNAFIAHANSSYGSLDYVQVPPSFLSSFQSSSLNFLLRRDVNVGWYYEGDDPAGSSERFSRTNVTGLLCIPQCWMALSGNYYLELPQIKDLFLLSQQDQSKQTTLWLPTKILK